MKFTRLYHDLAGKEAIVHIVCIICIVSQNALTHITFGDEYTPDPLLGVNFLYPEPPVNGKTSCLLPPTYFPNGHN